jgi:hypothetical protein
LSSKSVGRCREYRWYSNMDSCRNCGAAAALPATLAIGIGGAIGGGGGVTRCTSPATSFNSAFLYAVPLSFVSVTQPVRSPFWSLASRTTT